MNMIRSTIALVAIAVSVFSVYALGGDNPLSGSARMEAKRAQSGRAVHIDKQHNGGLFGAFAYFKGVIPDDVYVLEDVGVSCNESGAPDVRSPSRCKRYVSDSKNTTFVIRFSQDQDRAFFYKKVGDQTVLVPYVTFTNSRNEMVYASDEGRQFASAHGLGTGIALAASSLPSIERTPKVEVAAAGSKCDNVPEPLKGACLRTLLVDQKPPIKVGPVIGGILDAAKK